MLFLFVFLASSVFAETPVQWFKPGHRTKTLKEREELRKPFIKQIDANRKIIKWGDKNVLSLQGDTLGIITGTVTDNYGKPLEGIGFFVYNTDCNLGYLISS